MSMDRYVLSHLYPLYTACMSIAASSFAQSLRKLNPLPKAWILVAAACCREDMVRLLLLLLLLLLSGPLTLTLLSPAACVVSTIAGSCAVLILLMAGVDTLSHPSIHTGQWITAAITQ